jgi:hypothetical protein
MKNSIVDLNQLVRKDMDVNEYKRQSNFTLRHRLMLQTGLILLF